MFTVLNCIADQHDPRLLLVALVICAISAATGIAIYARAAAARGYLRIRWSAFAGFITGCGVWATHFVSMLAYESQVPISYAPGLTALSMIAAVSILGCGFFISAGSLDLRGRMIGGVVVGAGIAAMHFIGVAAMAGPTVIGLDHALLIAALAIGLIAGGAAMVVTGIGSPMRRFVGGVGLLILAIVGLHFTAMAAMTLAPDQLHSTSAAAMAHRELALEVASVVGLILTAAIALLMVSTGSARSALRSLQSALDVAPTAIAFFDRDRRLSFWNKPYAELFEAFGVSPAVGLRFESILAASAKAGVPYRSTSQSVSSGAFSWKNPPDEVELPDGRIMQAKVGPTRDGGMVAVLVDVTLTRQAERDAHDARERAEAADQLKSDFLATMAHEIRTPLNGVLGMTYVMESGPLDPKQRERLKVIKTSGESLLSLLSDMLDFAKIEAGYLKLQETTFDLGAVLATACSPFAAMAADKGVKFDLNVAPSAIGHWRGDEQRLRQVVSNLVANAVKFTEVGAVGVVVDTTEIGLRILVRDTGIGMKPDQIPRLFEKFTQADSTNTRKYGGTGLGLAICRDLTNLMEGTLTARSIEGQGSIFTFEAPLAHVKPALAAKDKTAPPALAEVGQLRILAAEDDPINQEVLAALLEPLGAKLVMTADGDAAVAAYCKGQFDMVLMDIHMPKMNGMDATRAIRAWEAQQGLPPTPILAVTANLMTHHIAAYRDAGIDGVVGKPIHVGKLFDAIVGVLPLQRAA